MLRRWPTAGYSGVMYPLPGGMNMIDYSNFSEEDLIKKIEPLPTGTKFYYNGKEYKRN